jgi:hypothetical protein
MIEGVKVAMKLIGINTLLAPLSSRIGDLSPKFKTMNSMRFPIILAIWRSQYEEAIFRRTNHQGHQAA